MFDRQAGILLHPTSFETRFGIGDFGKCAIDFLDFLEKSSQKLWQILPIGPTSFGDSPYQSFSTFAGNTMLISPEILIEEGLLLEEETYNELPYDYVAYGDVIKFKTILFKKAFQRFNEIKSKKDTKDFNDFCEKNKKWLDDYALYISLKEYYINERANTFETKEYKAFYKKNKDVLTKAQIDDYFYGAMWTSFDEDIKMRKSTAISSWNKKLEKEICFQKFMQYKFFSQLENLRLEAKKRDIKIIGDIPIFVSMDSSDVWANKELFLLSKDGNPTSVAGVPPDYFSETGQLWGNPLYKWENHKKDGYKWWVERIKSASLTADIIRIDHFRGFESYWEVPYGEETAIIGKWVKGPSEDFFNTVLKEIPDVEIIAEDLGDLTDDVKQLRDDFNLAGMKILQFAFDSEKNEYLPHNFVNNNCVIYTGTHDNDTTKGFYEKATEKEKDLIRRYLNVSGENIVYDLIRLAYSSCANICIIPMQDILELNSDARMNTPGVKTGNWTFRYRQSMLTDDISNRLSYLVELFNR